MRQQQRVVLIGFPGKQREGGKEEKERKGRQEGKGEGGRKREEKRQRKSCTEFGVGVLMHERTYNRAALIFSSSAL